MASHIKQDDLVSKIDELNRIAWEIRVSDSNKAAQYSREAIELSKKINYKLGLADGLSIEGFGFIRMSDFNKALVCLNQAKIIYESLKNVRGLAIVYEYKGIIERNLGNSATALEFIFKALELSQQSAFTDHETTNLYQLGVTYHHLADYDKALEYLYKSLSLARSLNFTLMEAYNLNIIGSIYFETNDYERALNYYKQGLAIRQQSGDKWGEAGSLDNIGFTYLKLKDYQRGIEYCKKSLEITRGTGDKKGQANALLHIAEIYKQSGDIKQATEFINESLIIRKQNGDKRGEAEIFLFLSSLNKDSPEKNNKVFEWLKEAAKLAEEIKALDLLNKSRFALYEYHKGTENFKEAIQQLEMHITIEKELHKNAIRQKVLNLEISHKAEETEKEAKVIRLKNDELTKLNKKIEKQKIKLEGALTDLKEAQAQLIQSEKMASLGELTAGIAHEIQNPLNFVINFSEINRELINELQQELANGKIEDVIVVLNNIKENEGKINHYGKRGDAIVKNMLQHSRRSAGKKEPTNINVLADEYLRLAYHGMRAKDKSFNAALKTYLDDTIGNINIVPQDIGRVMLNLINNAFYACTERSRSAVKEKNTLRQAQDDRYEPTVSISTKKINDAIEIKVADNGNGIPPKVLDKIFQPFFTTKPTGQGTGLGLSLSYDIVKAHGGELKVETKEGEGSVFIICLPFN